MVGYYLLKVFFVSLALLLWTRIALRYLQVSALHPVSQVIHKLSNPIIHPIERLFFVSKKRVSRYDWTCFIVLVVLEFVKFFLIGFLLLGQVLPFPFLPVPFLITFTVGDLFIQPCNFLFYAIIIRVIMSWVNPGWRHPLAELLQLVTEPLLRLGRRIIPDISGFDFSPIIVLMILKVITLCINNSLPAPLPLI